MQKNSSEAKLRNLDRVYGKGWQREVGSLLVLLLPVDLERKDISLVICLCKLNRAGSLVVLYSAYFQAGTYSH